MKKIKVFECFAGIGSQHRAMFNLFNNNELLEKNGINKEKYGYEIVGTSEWFIDAIIGYDIIHNGDYKVVDYYEYLTRNYMLKEIETFSLSTNSKSLTNIEYINTFSLEKLKQLFIALQRNKNFGSIVDINPYTLPDIDLLTYSFPCFTAGHKITTNNGYKNIEDVKVNDYVLTHKNRYKKVLCIMQKTSNHIYKIKTKGDDKILEVTAEHPFYVINKNLLIAGPHWVDVKDLNKKKHYLLKHNNLKQCYSLKELMNIETIEESIKNMEKSSTCGLYELIEIESITLEYKEIEVYNFEVEDDNSYVVENIIVHNCQDISSAGFQKGLEEGSNTRSSLLWEVKRILNGLNDVNKLPKFLLMENVKNLLSNKHFHNWKTFENFLTSLGYKNTLIELNSLEVGIPQSRDRVFCISELNGKTNFSLKNYNFDYPNIRDFLNVDNPLYIDEYKENIPINSAYRIRTLETSTILNKNNFVKTITTRQDRIPNPGIFICDDNGFLSNEIINLKDNKASFRFITPREALLLMGFTNKDYFKMIENNLSNNTIYMFAGNSIVVNKLELIFLEILKRI